MLTIQEAYEKYLATHPEEGICDYGIEEKEYYVFYPAKYNGDFVNIAYKVSKITGEVSGYGFLEYLEDMKDYKDDEELERIILRR